LRFIETGRSGQPQQVRGPGDEMRRRETVMTVYKIIRLVGTSPTSWEEAAKNAVEEASKHLQDLRISEVEQLDMRLEDGKVVEYRARVHVSFRYKGSE
jgi:flavin-binding protein dodecin